MEKFKKYLYQNLHWILIVISLILISLGYFLNDKENLIDDILRNVGYSIIGTGVFASILKSIQFVGIFKDELSKVVTGDEFIKNRKDLPQLWKKITQKVYNEKFPEVSDHLEDMLMTYYLPSNSKHYYRDYTVTIDIHSISDDFIIEYTQTNEYTIVLASDAEETVLQIGSTITEQENTDVKNEIKFFKVNGVHKEIEKVEDTNEKVNDFRFTLNGGEREFKIEIQFERKYSLHNENYKKFILRAYLKRMDVLVNHPEDVAVSFFSIGSVTKFRKLHIGIKNQLHRRHDEGLIMPFQGFGLSFEKNNRTKK
jgi:hypothetical protein